MKTNSVPKIRFKGFTDDWEQRKVSDIFKITRGYVLSATETIDTNDESNCFPVYSSQTKNDGLMGYYSDYLYEDAITWTTDGANAGTVRYRTGKFYCTNVCGVLLSEDGYANKAVSEVLNSVAWKYVSHVGNPKLMNNVMAEIEIVIPKFIEEQKVISKYFDKIDHLITLHQRKCDQTRELKKFMLQKMFPKKGEKNPEIRFSGFTDDWEQRKLGEMGSTYTGLSGKTKEDFGHGNAKFITYMNVFSNPIANLEMTDLIEVDQKQNKVKKGDVFFTTSSETPEEVGMSCVMPVNADNIYLNSFCFGYRPEVEFDSNYLAYVLRADAFRKEMRILAQGISRYNISKAKVMEVEISIPSLKEQKLVGSYFSTLDHLITLHQRKCEQLKELKKFMLQNMFPKKG